MKKYKATGCARFLLFLVIFAPLAFFGASYLNGNDPIGQIKQWLGAENVADLPKVVKSNDDCLILKSELDRLNQENKKLKQKIELMESQLQPQH